MERKITTRATQLLECATPIIVPPMAGASGGALAAQATLAGGFGFVSCGYEGLDKFVSEIKTAETIISASGIQTQVLPIGVGFLVWKLNESPDSVAQKALAYVLDRGVKAIWLSFGDKLGSWVHHIRQHPGPNKPLIVILVSTLEEAGIALEEWKSDIIVAQGTPPEIVDPEPGVPIDRSQATNLADMVLGHPLRLRPFFH